jgi:adrenodoxin-NADP+ reductase
MEQRRKVTSTSAAAAEARGPLKVAIVGSGPAGMYAARTLLRKVQDVEVDLIEMLPTPYGLVRYGVAPDHADTKNVTTEFSQILSAPNCAFKGNVTVGKDVTIEELLRLFHAVVLAYGAEADRQLGIPGENLEGSISARDFVNWYNGHPHYTKFAPKLTAGEDAVIIGNGNVAIDVARVLLKPLGTQFACFTGTTVHILIRILKTDALRSTDIASHALEALGGSTISRVHIVGRRGPAQAAFTIAELREIVNLKGLNVRMRAEELALDEVDEAEMNKKRPLKRMLSLLQESFAAAKDPLVKKELHLRFLQSPTQATPDAHAGSQHPHVFMHTPTQATPHPMYANSIRMCACIRQRKQHLTRCMRIASACMHAYANASNTSPDVCE